MITPTIKILQNNSFHALSIHTGIVYRTLEKRIFNRMIAEGIIEGYNTTDIAGKSVYDVFQSCGLNKYQIAYTLFEKIKGTITLTEILKEVYFWGIDGDCPDCGLKVEFTDTDWNEQGQLIDLKECANCNYQTNEINED
jgi:Zn ribbon nucleic-acid-binding protein